MEGTEQPLQFLQLLTAQSPELAKMPSAPVWLVATSRSPSHRRTESQTKEVKATRHLLLFFNFLGVHFPQRKATCTFLTKFFFFVSLTVCFWKYCSQNWSPTRHWFLSSTPTSLCTLTPCIPAGSAGCSYRWPVPWLISAWITWLF